MSELRIMAKESKAAVIAISETWLDSSVINSEIQIEGYSILCNDRDHDCSFGLFGHDSKF
jgi:hypothetical protein